MAVYGYLRVSTDEQELNNQRLAILDFANRRKINVDQWIEIKISSRKTPKARKIDELLGKLKPGDTLIVAELSRLGRSISEIIRITDDLIKNGITFHSLKESIHLNGHKDIQTKIMITLIGLFAEVERDLISQRTKEGLQRARAEGKLLGRPKGPGKSRLDPHRLEIEALLRNGSTKTYIAKRYGVTPANLTHYLKTRNITVEPITEQQP